MPIKNIPRASVATLPNPDPDLRGPIGRPMTRSRARGGPTWTDMEPQDFRDINANYVPIAVFLEGIWNAFLRRRFSMCLSKVLPSLTPDDFLFRETAFAMIAIARGMSGNLTFGNEGPTHPISDKPWLAVFLGGQCRHFVSELANGYHEAGAGAGSAPDETTYWLKGVIVHLAIGLTQDLVVGREIQDATTFAATSRGRARPRVLNILLISIQHVVIARVEGEQISRTRAMTLFDLGGPYTKYPLHENGLRTFRHARGRGTIRTWDAARLPNGQNPPFEPVHSTAFFAIMNLFEIGAHDVLIGPGRGGPGRPPIQQGCTLPQEIMEMVAYYSDFNANRAQLWMSPGWRAFSLEKFWLNESVFIDVKATKALEQGPAGATRHNYQINYYINPLVYEFVLVNLANDQTSRHRFWFDPHSWSLQWQNNTATGWLVLCGIRNRNHSQLTNLCNIGFQGFQFQRHPANLHACRPSATAQLQLQLHNRRLPFPPTVLDWATITQYALWTPENAAFRRSLPSAVRFNSAQALDSIRAIWVRDVSRRYLGRRGRMELLWPQVLSPPPLSDHFLLGSHASRFRRINGTRKRYIRQRALFFIHMQLVDLRRKERRNFARAIADVKREVGALSLRLE